MREPLRVWIGWDDREGIAWHVLAHSILTRASIPVAFIPLRQDALRSMGIYTRERGPTESTAFSMTRFLVPYLSGYWGTSVFMDCDILCRVDIAELLEEVAHAETRAMKDGKPMPAVSCVQHNYVPIDSLCRNCQHMEVQHDKPSTYGYNKCSGNHERCECTHYDAGGKFLGNVQTAYARKNWSSLMVFRNERCAALTPEYVNRASGLELHRFQWVHDLEIGALPLEWNHLVSEYPPNPDARLAHFTTGGPWLPGYESVEFAGLWLAERDAMMGQVVAA